MIYRYLNHLNIQYNQHIIYRFLNSHPFHPSLLSISDLFDYYSIENAVIAIPKENFSRIPTPFIAKTSSSDGDFCYVININKENITYINEKNKTIIEPLDIFYIQYSGVVLVAEKNHNSIEPNYSKNKKENINKNVINIATVSFALISTVIIFLHNYIDIQSAFPLIIKLLGLSVSVLLILQMFNLNNPFVNRLCSNASGNGCDTILSSNASKIFNDKLSWSEVGLFYFLTTYLSLLFLPTHQNIIFLKILNLLSLPYTLYSIFYQYKIAKQWCKLCLITQTILWLEFLSFIPFNIQNITFNTKTIYVILLNIVIGGLIVSFWFLIKPFISKIQSVTKLQRDINVFKRDANIFHALLKNQPTINHPIDESVSLNFGNSNADFEILFVSNPFCGPCAVAHNKIEKLFEKHKNNILLKFVFTAVEEIDDERNKIISVMIANYLNKNKDISYESIQDWYSNAYGSPEKWLKKYSIEVDDLTRKTIKDHSNWCSENDITHTPMIFINKHLALSEYTFEDLDFFIQQKKTNTIN